MKRTALITGITGQDGSYLAEWLLSQGYQVHGMMRRTSSVNLERIEHLQDKIQLHFGDLLDQHSLTRLVAKVRPTEVYNLAAQSFVPTSWEQPIFTAEATGLGVTRLLDAIREVDPQIRFYQASSSEMYGTTWVQLDSINTNNNAWALKEYRLDQFITLGPTVRVRVISLDEGAGGSLVESAIDDITVTAVDCSAPCPSDLDGNSTVDSGDIGVLLLAFGDCSGACPSDLDGNSTVDAGDIGVLLLAFGSCP